MIRELKLNSREELNIFLDGLNCSFALRDSMLFIYPGIGCDKYRIIIKSEVTAVVKRYRSKLMSDYNRPRSHKRHSLD